MKTTEIITIEVDWDKLDPDNAPNFCVEAGLITEYIQSFEGCTLTDWETKDADS